VLFHASFHPHPVTTFRYGDLTTSGKTSSLWFLVAYCLLSTLVVANALGDFIDMYVNQIVGEGIIAKIIDSTIWVHKCDTFGLGQLNEADYMLFKLMQMQKVGGGSSEL